jgi:hypothetical protein
MDPTVEAARAGYSKAPFKGYILSPCLLIMQVAIHGSYRTAGLSNYYCYFVNSYKFVRVVEALENQGYRIPLTKEEADLYERLVTILKQVRFFLHCS